MIKRIKKVMALMLIATSVVTIVPENIFSIQAYAAVTGTITTPTAAPTADTVKAMIDAMIKGALSKLPTDAQVNYLLAGKLKEQYNKKGIKVEKIIISPSASFILPMNDNLANTIADAIVRKGLMDAKKDPDTFKKSNPTIYEALVAGVKPAIKDVPIYGYVAIDATGKPVGKGFVVSGPIEGFLVQKGKEPIYVDATDLAGNSASEILGKMLKQVLSKINIEDILAGTKIGQSISGAIDDVADSIDNLGDSMSDLFDDLNDHTDDFLDRINKDEGWDKTDGYIYYYDEDGIKLRGVNEIKGKKYYFNRIDGALETGWQIVDGKRCYFSPKNRYQVFSQWIKDGDKIYCLDANGEVRKSQWAQNGNKTCYLKADGTVVTNKWFKIDDYWYYFDNNGNMENSTWKWCGDSWYYLGNDGAAANKWTQINNKWYCFKDPSGAMYTGWFRHDGSWYCADDDGSMKTGWAYSSDGWCYLDDESGKMKKNEWALVDGNWYYFNLNGIMVTGTRYINATKYHFSSDGILE